MKSSKPIPDFGGDSGTTHVPIKDSMEDLTILEPTRHIHASPVYYKLGYPGASAVIRLRIGTLAALSQVAASLPDGMSILVWDALRTLKTQDTIARHFAHSLAEQALDSGERDAIVLRYVSALPETKEEYHRRPPPHTTGGAVDVTLADKNGCPLDLGAGFDQFDPTAWTTHYEGILTTTALSAQDRRRCELRRILFWAMVGAGFAPYPWEFWHFEYRTQRAAGFYGETFALYGPAVPFEAQDDRAPVAA